jgi:hypothetical protein
MINLEITSKPVVIILDLTRFFLGTATESGAHLRRHNKSDVSQKMNG